LDFLIRCGHCFLRKFSPCRGFFDTSNSACEASLLVAIQGRSGFPIRVAKSSRDCQQPVFQNDHAAFTQSQSVVWQRPGVFSFGQLCGTENRVESVSKKSFGPNSALGAYIKSSKYRMYSSGLIFAAALILNKNLFFEIGSGQSGKPVHNT